jgi:YD repeat-containing protein
LIKLSSLPSRLKYIRKAVAAAVVLGILGFTATASDPAYAGSATYKYDNLGRLTSITYGTGVVINYTYDAAGNRGFEVISGTGKTDPQAQAAVMAIILQMLLDN